MKRNGILSTVLLMIIAGCASEAPPEPAPEPASGPGPAPVLEAVDAGFQLPPGFTATLFAEGLVTPRHIVVNDNGDVYVTIRSGQAKFRATDEPGGVVALRDTNGDGVADETGMFGTADIDTGLALANGYLYYSSMTTIYASELGDELVPGAPAEIVVADMPQSGAGHRTKPITIDSNGNLYTQVGNPSNACQTEPGTPGSPGLMPCTQQDEHGGVFRFSAAARNQVHADTAFRYSRGHRNIVALEWNDSAGALYGLMHDRDSLSRLWPDYYTAEDDIELPAEEFHRIDEGDDLGFPYTYWDPIRNERMVMPEYGGDGETAAEPGLYKAPLIGFPGHWAPDDIVFYTADQFPDRYRNGAFLAFHGPVVPQRADPGGYAVVFVPMNGAGDMTGDWEFFADAFETLTDTTDSVGRPAGLAVGPQGSLYIVDDAGGRIWKVSYSG